MSVDLITKIKDWYSNPKIRKTGSNLFWLLIAVFVLVFFFFRGRVQQSRQGAIKFSEGLSIFYSTSEEETMGMQKGIFPYKTKEEKLDAALERFNEVIEFYKNSRSYPVALFYKGNILFEKGNYNEATEIFKEIIDKFKKHRVYSQALLKLGYMYDADNKPSDAINVFDSITDEFPENNISAYAYYHKSFCYQKLGQMEKAKDSLNSILEKDYDISFKEEVENRLKFLSFLKGESDLINE